MRALTRKSGFPMMAGEVGRMLVSRAERGGKGKASGGGGWSGDVPPTTPLAAPAPIEDQALISVGL